MAPDAEKLRQRRVALDETEPTTEVVLKVDELKTTHVCIEGVVYDLEGFDHPGGESIFVFGGNDVTTQYKMIHPYHTDKHLEKLKRVGKVSDYKSE